MRDAGASETPPDGRGRPSAPGTSGFSRNPLVEGPILQTLLRLTAPNALALVMGVLVVVAETSYVGLLGTAPLAAIALMFPVILLMMTMSGGAMGGGVSSAISRALGAREPARASTLAVHALTLGIGAGAAFSMILLILGRQILFLLGGRGPVLEEADAFLKLFALGTVLIWLMNTLSAILRGTGNMRLPSATMFSSALCQIVIGGTLALGLGGAPRLGLTGIAIGQLAGFSLSAMVMGWYILAGRSPVRLIVRPFGFRWEMFADILKVGAIACFYPVQGVLTVGVITSMLSTFGPEVLAGYSIGARLEFMVTSVAFATGVASAPMVGMAIGAGRVARARRVAWTAAVVAFVGVSLISAPFAIWPDQWVSFFTDDAGVRAANREYLSVAAPAFAFIGLGVALYFASQGAARVLGSVISQFVRLAFVIAGGSWLLSIGAGSMSFFFLAAIAMVIFGLSTALSVWVSSWGAEKRPHPTGQ